MITFSVSGEGNCHSSNPMERDCRRSLEDRIDVQARARGGAQMRVEKQGARATRHSGPAVSLKPQRALSQRGPGDV